VCSKKPTKAVGTKRSRDVTQKGTLAVGKEEGRELNKAQQKPKAVGLKGYYQDRSKTYPKPQRIMLSCKRFKEPKGI